MALATPWPETLREGENSARWLDLTSRFEHLQTTDWSCWWLMGWVPSPAGALYPLAPQVPQDLEYLGKSKMCMPSHLTSGKRKCFEVHAYIRRELELALQRPQEHKALSWTLLLSRDSLDFKLVISLWWYFKRDPSWAQLLHLYLNVNAQSKL